MNREVRRDLDLDEQLQRTVADADREVGAQGAAARLGEAHLGLGSDDAADVADRVEKQPQHGAGDERGAVDEPRQHGPGLVFESVMRGGGRQAEQVAHQGRSRARRGSDGSL